MKRIAIFISLLLVGCAANEDLEVKDASRDFLVGVSSDIATTRTSLNGLSLSWTTGDRIGVFADGLQYNKSFGNTGRSDFAGYFTTTDTIASSKEYYAYYPYVFLGATATTTITADLPHNQMAPFDCNANYMVADVVTAPYDESNMPDLSFTFNNQLFSIVKITVTNSDADIQNEKLVGVEINAPARILAGTFTFDVSDGGSATATFDNTSVSNSSNVMVNYAESDKPTLGLNTPHVVYAIVKPGTFAEIQVKVRTDTYIGTVTSSNAVTFGSGSVYELQPVNFGSLARKNRTRTVVCFGDSITPSNVITHLQTLLGPDWQVMPAGVSGEKVIQIAARQGAAPLYIQDAFTIPASKSQSVAIGTSFYTTWQTNGDISETPSNALLVSLTPYNKLVYCGLTNPFKVNGIECNITKSNDVLYLQRTTDGEALMCDANTQAIPFAAWNYRDADVITTYMGTNGAYAANVALGYTKDQVLANMYQAMTDYSTKKHHIIVGYHTKITWTQAYHDVFTERFGNNFLDMKLVGSANASEISTQLGIALTETDNTLIANNEWPASWQNNYLRDVHPNVYGHRAYAIMVYNRMRELGYLDY